MSPNNIAFGTGGNISNLNGSKDTYNSWNLSVTLSYDDFVSVDTAEALTDHATNANLKETSFLD